jgi:hypothetical protein
MKIGDKVVMLDESYSTALLPNGEVREEFETGGVYTEDELYVALLGCKMPSMAIFSKSQKNDTVLYNKTKGYYVCTQERFLNVVDK